MTTGKMSALEKVRRRKIELRALRSRVGAVQEHIIRSETTPEQRKQLSRAGYTTQTRLVRTGSLEMARTHGGQEGQRGVTGFTSWRSPRPQTTMVYTSRGAKHGVRLLGDVVSAFQGGGTQTVRHEIGHQILGARNPKMSVPEHHRILMNLEAQGVPLSSLNMLVLRERIRSARDQEPGGPIIRGLRGLKNIKRIDR